MILSTHNRRKYGIYIYIIVKRKKLKADLCLENGKIKVSIKVNKKIKKNNSPCGVKILGRSKIELVVIE
jgi:hypothetical protein